MSGADAVVTGRPRLIDRYALRQSAGPLIACLVVTLAALLLERALRLFDLLSGSSARFGYVFELTANLLPHYLGLALPAAFFVSLFVVVARMSDGSEIDAWLASGVGLSRLIRPFLALGILLTVISVAVFGYLQPYSRYGYRAVMHAAVNAGWNGRLQAQTFIEPSDKLLMTADEADLAGRKLGRLFIRQTRDDGLEDITTAASAELRPSEDGKRVELNLVGGQRLRETSPGVFDVTRFDRGVIDAPLEGAAALLRARGGDERELTLGELWEGVRDGHPGITKATMAAEFNARLARALSLPFLPLLAVPLALSAKRSGRAPGLVVAGVTLLAFHHGVQFVQSLAGAGRLSPLMVWLPYLIFVALCLWSFHGCRARPGQTPMTPVIEAISDVILWARNLVKPKREARA